MAERWARCERRGDRGIHGVRPVLTPHAIRRWQERGGQAATRLPAANAWAEAQRHWAGTVGRWWGYRIADWVFVVGDRHGQYAVVTCWPWAWWARRLGEEGRVS
ncbi:MAG: hypothetical protein K6V97_04095 [Actinomycetia bacterium]|nr:hypothetical protein [Actinomycetes bacterium]